MPRPNILWICTDQQRYDTLGCYGNPYVTTPNLDRLAQGGVLFEGAYTQNPVCTPSRACFLTGRYPRTTRCRQNGQSIPEDEVLITKLLADAGYTCGLSGKLHLSACHPSVCKSSERRVDDGYADFHWSHDPAPQWPANEYFLWLQEQGMTFEEMPCEVSEYVTYGAPSEYHQTGWCAQKAINFIQEQARYEQPWLYSVNIFDPHHPFDPPEEYLRPYLERLDEIPLPNYAPGELEDKPVYQRIDHVGAYGRPGSFAYDQMETDDHRAVRAAYWATIDLIDRQVGRMLSALERTGQRENTIVIFMSDHGEMLGDHGIYLKGPHFYEPAVHVPLIISWPEAIRGGRRVQGLVELCDLAPTLLDALEMSRHPGMQGNSFWPILADADGETAHRADVYSEFYNANFRHHPPAYGTMLRTEDYKLVVFHGRDEGELYDLREDPDEIYNHWDDPEYAAIQMRLLKRLCDRMAFTVDPLPERQSPW